MTIRDQVVADLAALEALGVTQVAAVVGGSMGGARALEWIVGHPDTVRAALILAVGARATADQIGTQSTQVAAIKADPHWCGGDYHDTGRTPATGLALARRFAHLTYRGEQELDDRFGNDAQGEEDPTTGGRYAVQSYLEYQGAKLVERFDAGTYVALTDALSSHDVGRGRGGVRAALQRCRVPAIVGDHLRPALPAAAAGRARRPAARLHRAGGGRFHLRPRRVPGRVGGRRQADPAHPGAGGAVTREPADPSLSFGAQAAAYERGRPSYPPEAIDWLLPSGAHTVLDLGAGTGKLTTRLVERGLDVIAVDPIPEMLEVLTGALPETPALLGTAEEIPLADDSVDAVLVAQAWHWFDPERAVKEVTRVLRPGGRLGLVWNTRDERMGWVKDLGRIIGHENDPFTDQVSLPGPFTDIQRHHVEWTSYLTPQALIDLVASRSYCITSPAEVRTRTLDRVRELLATHPALVNAAGLALPYVTVCIRATMA